MLTRELAGDFLMYMYNNGFILGNRIAAKTFVQRKFKSFLDETHRTLGALDNEESLDSILNDYDFVCKVIRDEKIYKFDLRALFAYRNELIAEFDEKQMENANSVIKQTDELNTNSFYQEKPKILEDFPSYELIYQFRAQQTINECFILSSKGCYSCQVNFKNEDEYAAHIDYHSQESDFEYRTKCLQKNQTLPKQFFVTYKLCEKSHLLFTIKSQEHDKSIIIEKIIVFRSGTVHYLEDALCPYFLPSDGSSFYVNCHIFQIAYEQPMLIVFKLKDDPKGTRYVEEHHFLRFDVFPANLNLKTKHVFRRGEMQFKRKLSECHPTALAKQLHFVDFDEKVHPLKRTIRDFFKKTTTLNHENVAEVFAFLVEMEDFALCNAYEKFKRNNLKIQGCASDYSVNIPQLPENETIQNILSSGDRIILTKKGGGKNESVTNEKSYYGAINSIIGNRVYFESKSGKIPIDLSYEVKFEPQRLNFKYQHQALETLRCDIHLRARLFPENVRNLTSTSISSDYFNSSVAENPEQREAVEHIIDNSNKHVPFIIFGPPGTGKTTLVVETILQLWKKSKNFRILVTAGSNAACDEVASRLCKTLNKVDPDGLNLLRIYAMSVEKKSDNLNEDVLEASNLCYGQHFYPSLETIYVYPIVVVTLSVAGRLVHADISNNHFTHVFIDECGASTEPECLMGLSGILSSSGHLILSGDPKQLGPIIDCRRASAYGLGLSLLERLMDRECYQQHPITKEYNRSIQVRLVRNFRSHKDILALPNQLYYNNDLKVMASPEITDIAIGWSGLRSKDFPIIFESVKGRMRTMKTSTSSCNYEELNSVMLSVKELMFFGIKDRKIREEDIGIISPYKMQCQLIRRELDRRGWYRIETGSVETFQGQEKPIIIASMVRSRVDTPGFLNNPKRLNVLLTRAQALLILIGNPDTLKKIGDWKYVVDYCIENNAVIGAKMNSSDADSNESDTSTITQSVQDLSMKDDRNVKRFREHKSRKTNNVHGAKQNLKGSNDKKTKRAGNRDMQKNKNNNEQKGDENDTIKWLADLPNTPEEIGSHLDNAKSMKINKSERNSESSNRGKSNISKMKQKPQRGAKQNAATKANENSVKTEKQFSVNQRPMGESAHGRNIQNESNKKQHRGIQLLPGSAPAGNTHLSYQNMTDEKHQIRQNMYNERRNLPPTHNIRQNGPFVSISPGAPGNVFNYSYALPRPQTSHVNNPFEGSTIRFHPPEGYHMILPPNSGMVGYPYHTINSPLQQHVRPSNSNNYPRPGTAPPSSQHIFYANPNASASNKHVVHQNIGSREKHGSNADAKRGQRSSVENKTSSAPPFKADGASGKQETHNSTLPQTQHKIDLNPNAYSDNKNIGSSSESSCANVNRDKNDDHAKNLRGILKSSVENKTSSAPSFKADGASGKQDTHNSTLPQTQHKIYLNPNVYSDNKNIGSSSESSSANVNRDKNDDHSKNVCATSVEKRTSISSAPPFVADGARAQQQTQHATLRTMQVQRSILNAKLKDEPSCVIS